MRILVLTAWNWGVGWGMGYKHSLKFPIKTMKFQEEPYNFYHRGIYLTVMDKFPNNQ